jgi:hypothetical protein
VTRLLTPTCAARNGCSWPAMPALLGASSLGGEDLRDPGINTSFGAEVPSAIEGDLLVGIDLWTPVNDDPPEGRVIPRLALVSKLGQSLGIRSAMRARSLVPVPRASHPLRHGAVTRGQHGSRSGARPTRGMGTLTRTFACFGW